MTWTPIDVEVIVKSLLAEMKAVSTPRMVVVRRVLPFKGMLTLLPKVSRAESAPAVVQLKTTGRPVRTTGTSAEKLRISGGPSERSAT